MAWDYIIAEWNMDVATMLMAGYHRSYIYAPVDVEVCENQLTA